VNISTDVLNQKHRDGLYDSPDPNIRQEIILDDFPLLDADGKEVHVFGSNGNRVLRRKMLIDRNQPSCPVLVDLSHIQTLFKPNPDLDKVQEDDESYSDYVDEDLVRVDAYPLGFLKTAGNIQATGVPNCFYPILKTINGSVRKNHQNHDNALGGGDEMDVDNDEDYAPSFQSVVRPVSSQFYSYLAHRTASRAGRHDSQHGHVTAAISGAYAKNPKDKTNALDKQTYCNQSLPFERFHDRISIDDCPTSCRAELVYTIDVRALKDPSGS
jgi:hypothetical protein